MMIDAILFLTGAVLFLLAVLFFVFLWQERLSVVNQRTELEEQAESIKSERVDLDIWEHELEVWARGLERQQLALEEAREELRMLTASKQVSDEDVDGQDGAAQPQMPETRASSRDARSPESHLMKNRKQEAEDLKL